ncbi:MAG: EscU/YscU/HrcU family type III secretion system export apparatus switch protein [Motiliproteus sp.]|nr:EscU/YscU/HrcU family type III secretion system export apparatus switch protein [Motiliproteus sp.]MCW9051738.1 EscU/YscU/HrcU family type III secretion system export apparatus switch protein [Motiliproteus sp.]
MTDDTQKPALAVALTYDEQSPPHVAASGRGLIAEEILRIAREHGVMIHEDPALVESLIQLELGQEIPENLYKAIAEVISFAYSLRDGELQRSDD